MILPRQVGHTETAIHGVIKNPLAILIVSHQQDAKSIENQHPELRGRVKTWNGDSFRGSRSPIVFDHFFVEKIYNELHDAKLNMEGLKLWSKDYIWALKSTIAEKDIELDRLKKNWFNKIIQWFKK